MPRVVEKVKRAAGKRIEEFELKILASEGKKSLQRKAAAAKRLARKAMKAGFVAGAVVATAVVMRERRKRRALDG
jgi:hypothetical protein